ncbi:hypothetical protein EDEG_00877 [Edhazardia aedis USNM 41457]|uniref:Uncharacterized protein n=1 Tax=Edhazardia aedis (strain USNM 41457) TaxID=1003232 RepID=J9DC02_EDHAE|nr:hypothetical protein EDEG_00877 [Edhazardia aedis USNM 41457]|eukprot:EJW05024.1 hypothetical protein EDEG_00877 [Edhazardia aedis USNM 41457]
MNINRIFYIHLLFFINLKSENSLFSGNPGIQVLIKFFNIKRTNIYHTVQTYRKKFSNEESENSIKVYTKIIDGIFVSNTNYINLLLEKFTSTKIELQKVTSSYYDTYKILYKNKYDLYETLNNTLDSVYDLQKHSILDLKERQNYVKEELIQYMAIFCDQCEETIYFGALNDYILLLNSFRQTLIRIIGFVSLYSIEIRNELDFLKERLIKLVNCFAEDSSNSKAYKYELIFAQKYAVQTFKNSILVILEDYFIDKKDIFENLMRDYQNFVDKNIKTLKKQMFINVLKKIIVLNYRCEEILNG